MDDLDRVLIKELEADPRASHARLARCVGVTEKTVRNRINRMVESGNLTFVVETGGREQDERFVFLARVAAKDRSDFVAKASAECDRLDATWGAWDLLLEYSGSVAQASAFRDRCEQWGATALDWVQLLAPQRHVRHIEVDWFRWASSEVCATASQTGERLNSLLAMSMSALSADRGMAVVYDRTDDPDRARELVCAIRGLEADYLDTVRNRSEGSGEVSSFEHVVLLGQRLIVGDVTAEDSPKFVRENLSDFGYRGFLSVPLRLDGGVCGAMNLYFDSPIVADEISLDRFEQALSRRVESFLFQIVDQRT